MARRSRFPVALLTVVAVMGCDRAADKPGAASRRAESLWSSRAPYIGDNARVTALVGEVGLARAGRYSMRLQTAKQPYQLMIDVERPDQPIAVSEQATLLLGLVANLDEVAISSGEDGYVLTAEDASKNLGYDVKLLGQDQTSLLGYVQDRSD